MTESDSRNEFVFHSFMSVQLKCGLRLKRAEKIFKANFCEPTAWPEGLLQSSELWIRIKTKIIKKTREKRTREKKAKRCPRI